MRYVVTSRSFRAGVEIHYHLFDTDSKVTARVWALMGFFVVDTETQGIVLG